MEFIAQFNSSICGSNNTLISDVFLYKNNIVIFSKKSNGDFDLKTIDKNSYAAITGEFDNFIKNKNVHSKECNLLNLWRANKISNPILMPERYYEDVLKTHERQETIRKNQLKSLSDSINKLHSELLDELNNL